MDFDSWKPDGPEYRNVDSQLHMRLTTLYFFCNRPTLGALMAFGTDLGDAFKTGSSGQQEGNNTEEDSSLQAAESSASEADYEPGWPHLLACQPITWVESADIAPLSLPTQQTRLAGQRDMSGLCKVRIHACSLVY